MVVLSSPSEPEVNNQRNNTGTPQIPTKTTHIKLHNNKPHIYIYISVYIYITKYQQQHKSTSKPRPAAFLAFLVQELKSFLADRAVRIPAFTEKPELLALAKSSKEPMEPMVESDRLVRGGLPHVPCFFSSPDAS